MIQAPAALEPVSEAPLTRFANCHDGIVSQLNVFEDVPAMVAPAARACKIAEDTLQFFRLVVLDHHAEEEKELFPAVLASALAGPERENVGATIGALTAEHRAIEALWRKLEPQVEKLAKGQLVEIDAATTDSLVRKYRAHARREEEEFLPMCEEILGRNGSDMAALGLSLHQRHVFRDWRRGIRGS